MSFFSSFQNFGRLGASGPPPAPGLDKNSPYFKQALLLVRVLPYVAQEKCFALKGGTAINLFLRNLPRLSVDIDLAYLPDEDRGTALQNMQEALARIKNNLEGSPPGFRALWQGKPENRWLLVSDGAAQIKIEVNPVLRGTVWPAEERAVSELAESLFGFAEMQLLSFNDIYGGKICAALDRQHPRDFFDIKLLLENEGISRELVRTALVYFISGDGSIAELFDPKPDPHFEDTFKEHFQGMTAAPVSAAELLKAREALIDVIRGSLTDDDKEFLISFKSGNPDWSRLELEGIETLPAVRYKLLNLSRMPEEKHKDALNKWRRVLGK